MDWLKTLSGVYGPAAAVIIFVEAAVAVILWRAYCASQEARITDAKQGFLALTAAATGDAKAAVSLDALDKRVSSLETSLSSFLSTVLQIVRDSMK